MHAMRRLLLLIIFLLNFCFSYSQTNAFILNIPEDSIPKIRVVDIQVEVDFEGKEKNVERFLAHYLKLPHCSGAILDKDSILHILRKSFDPKGKTLLLVHYKNYPMFSNSGDNISYAFLKDRDSLAIPMALDTQKKAYMLTNTKAGVILRQKDGEKWKGKEGEKESQIKLQYKVKNKEFPEILYKVTETHKIKIHSPLPFQLEDGFACE